MGRKWTRKHHWQKQGYHARGLRWKISGDDWKPELLPEKTFYVAALVLDLAAKKIYLGHKYDRNPSWGLLGGHPEEGETNEKAIFRELRDEGGPEISRDKQGKLVGASKVFEHEANPRHTKIFFLVEASKGSFVPRIREKEEIDKVGWFTLPEILAMPKLPFDSAERDTQKDYIKETHRGYIVEILDLLGLLGEFGAPAAEENDYFAELNN